MTPGVDRAPAAPIAQHSEYDGLMISLRLKKQTNLRIAYPSLQECSDLYDGTSQFHHCNPSHRDLSFRINTEDAEDPIASLAVVRA